MAEEEIVNKDCYYKEVPDNEFYNYSIHGLNIEGIKKYYLEPTNYKYHHMVQLKKDLKKVIENSNILQKERQKKYDINNRYDDERLIKMYGVKKEEKEDNKNIINNKFNTLENNYSKNYDKTKSLKNINRRKILENPIEIKLEKDNINNKIGKEEMKQNILNGTQLNNINNKMKTTNFDKFGIHKTSNSFNKYRYGLNKNSYESFRKFNKSQKRQKELNLPFIKPRKIIIEYQLINDCGIEKENKNIGHNNYMGASFNPYNYSSNPKNRNSRNVYGSLFLH